VVCDFEIERRLGLGRAEARVQRAAAGGIKECRGIAAMHDADRIIGVQPRRAGEHCCAEPDLNELKIQHHQYRRAPPGGEQLLNAA
jgi:hypothetical protein